MKNHIYFPLFILIAFLTIASTCSQKPVAAIQTTEEIITPKVASAPITPNDNYYTEAHRPQFHFSPEEKWMNDPNGMVYYEEEYHLFYQYHPDGIVWGPMHWGHAISTDLVHWEHLPIALYPDSLGMIFSGSAVVDWDNTSGLGENGRPPMIAIFTYHFMEGEKADRNDFQYQGIAYSNDKGRTWTMYKGNPVIPNPGIRDFRDPKVIWHKDSKQWIMVFAAYDHVKFYGSPNLIDWKHLSDFGKTEGSHGGVWECPDLFPLTDKATGETRWILLQSMGGGNPNGGSGTQYFIGEFDGKNYNISSDMLDTYSEREAYVPEGLFYEDFENGYGDWTTEGTAFGNKPANGEIGQQNNIEGYTGDFLVNSFFGGSDEDQGKLISPNFTIQKDFINFQIGGGRHWEKTCMNLWVDETIVRTQMGRGNENLNWASWDVSAFNGKTAHLEILDKFSGSWGHINIDQIMFADEAATPATNNTLWLDWGRDNYAGVTWSDIPDSDGRRIFLGWMSNWNYAQIVPTKKWRSAMTIPHTLALQKLDNSWRVVNQPVKEMQLLRTGQTGLGQMAITESFNLNEMTGMNTTLSELILEIDLDKTEAIDFGIALSNSKGEVYKIGFDKENNRYYSDRRMSGKKDFSNNFAEVIHYGPRDSNNNILKLHLFFDVCSAELFADDGLTVITDLFFPNEDFSKMDIFTEDGNLEIISGQLFELKSTW